MTAKDCRGVLYDFSEMHPNPEAIDPRKMHIAVEILKASALWEIAAQLAEMNEKGKAVLQ
jgi:hypothetical protein